MTIEVRTMADIAALEGRVIAAAEQAAAALRALPGSGPDLFWKAKFLQIGRHPLKGHPLNLVEQINQTWTFLVGFQAVRLLIARHPEALGFRLNLGTEPGFDLDSIAPNEVQAETFAAVDPRNNKKLVKDLLRMREHSTARRRYVVFAAPDHAPGRHPELEDGSGVEVWAVDVQDAYAAERLAQT